MLAHDLAEEIERLVGREAVEAMDFEAVETAVRRQALRFAAKVVEQRLNADHGDFKGARRPCSCGQEARYVDRRTKLFQTVLSEMRLERAYYYCAACQRGFCPRDQQLGMEDISLSPAVTRMIGTVEPERMMQGMKAFREAITKAGIQHVYYEAPGTAHEWLTWRRDLHEFAPLLFRN